jgi:L-aspartate oxidase
MNDASTIVVGAGIGGLGTAIKLADAGRKVIVVSRTPVAKTASYRAQGGIAAALAPDDSFEWHAADTHAAGGDLCQDDTVDAVVRAAPDVVRWLQSVGVAFASDDASTLSLAREGGHGTRRVAYVGDATGRAIMSALTSRALAHPRITLLERHIVVDLTICDTDESATSRCAGVVVLDPVTGRTSSLPASAVVLATGGASGLYLHTTNPDAGHGDGIALAWRAGCRVANMEFVQFHPTSLYAGNADAFLISEALRGEGAVLRLPDGSRFMQDYDPRAELAPRDIVARAIHKEMATRDIDHVSLDISHQPSAKLRARFPVIHAACLAAGIDLTQEPIPVVPAAHYTCGGIMTDLHGRTDVRGLYALGECAFTGLHGANRLASNSLLEALCFAERIGAAIEEFEVPPAAAKPTAFVDTCCANDLAESPNAVHRLQDKLRRLMWNDVGIVRTNWGLKHAMQQLTVLQAQFAASGLDDGSAAAIDFRNQLLVARLITLSARARCESRGLHYNSDFPRTDDEAQDTVLVPPAPHAGMPSHQAAQGV